MVFKRKDTKVARRRGLERTFFDPVVAGDRSIVYWVSWMVVSHIYGGTVS